MTSKHGKIVLGKITYLLVLAVSSLLSFSQTSPGCRHASRTVFGIRTLGIELLATLLAGRLLGSRGYSNLANLLDIEPAGLQSILGTSSAITPIPSMLHVALGTASQARNHPDRLVTCSLQITIRSPLGHQDHRFCSPGGILLNRCLILRCLACQHLGDVRKCVRGSCNLHLGQWNTLLLWKRSSVAPQ